MQAAAAFARRWVHRKGDGATDTVPALEDQLQALQPICSAQRVSTGITCGAPAVAVAEIHAIDGCDHMGLSPDGDLVETQPIYRPNDPLCCPSGGVAHEEYRWSGTRLTLLRQWQTS